jgi:hypothetical protein
VLLFQTLTNKKTHLAKIHLMKTTSQLINRPRLGAQHNLLTQDVTATTGNAYRLTFLAGSKSSQGAACGTLPL